jgi:hypothetical protein
MMTYLDYERLAAIDTQAYQSAKPFPWVNPEGLLTPEGFELLRKSLPDVSELDRTFGKQRKGGQAPHDRYYLEYSSETQVSEPWQEFIEELKRDRYRREMCRLLGVSALSVNFHWHYAPRGCSVSPHCDARRKLGSHIFYFQTEEDWDERWGGATVVLDGHAGFIPESAPDFDDFDSAIDSRAMGNNSFIFTRTDNSWHGVRPVTCPEGYYRKVFIVVLNDHRPIQRFRNLFQGKGLERY